MLTIKILASVWDSVIIINPSSPPKKKSKKIVPFCYLHYNTLSDYLIIYYITHINPHGSMEQSFFSFEINQGFVLKILIFISPTNFWDTKKEVISKAVNIALATLLFFFSSFASEHKNKSFREVIMIQICQKAKQTKNVPKYLHLIIIKKEIPNIFFSCWYRRILEADRF